MWWSNRPYSGAPELKVSRKDFARALLKLVAVTVLALTVVYLIYRVRVLYLHHLKYQRLQRDAIQVQ